MQSLRFVAPHGGSHSHANGLGLTYDLPFLDAAANYIADLNEDHGAKIYPCKDRSIRKYQLELARTGAIKIVSPFSGELTTSFKSSILTDKAQLFSFRDPVEFIVGANSLDLGYTLSSIYVPSMNLVIELSDHPWIVRARHYSEYEEGKCLDAEFAAGKVAFFTGESNYAHCYWNQIPGLINAVQAAIDSDIQYDLTTVNEPFGPIDQIFPELHAERIRRINPQDLSRKPDPQSGVAFFPGSTRVSEVIRERLVSYCCDNTSPVARVFISELSKYENIFWLSVRSGNRTLTDQVKFLTELSAAIFRSFSNAYIVYDGYSLPADLRILERYSIQNELSCVARDVEIVNDIIKNVKRAVSDPNCRVLNAAGLFLPDSIAIAQHVKYYFCHHGTIQHKIGWTTQAQGIVHANRSLLEMKISGWAADQVENCPTPHYLDASHVSDDCTKQRDITVHGDLNEIMHRQNYSFIDEGQTINWAIDLYKAWSQTSRE